MTSFSTSGPPRIRVSMSPYTKDYSRRNISDARYCPGAKSPLRVATISGRTVILDAKSDPNNLVSRINYSDKTRAIATSTLSQSMRKHLS